MFSRIEIGVRPDLQDATAQKLLGRISKIHPEIRTAIRWARLLKVYWFELPAPREDLIPAISSVFWDRIVSWLFTGNLLPSAGGKHGTYQDLFDEAPIRPGEFWALERRMRSGIHDQDALLSIRAMEILLKRKLPEARGLSGSLLLLEGPLLTEDALTLIAKDVFCNELMETWTLIPASELRKNDRFHPERIKRDLPKVFLRPLSLSKTNLDTIPLSLKTDEELLDLSKERCWGLSSPEMRMAAQYFSNPDFLEQRKSMGLEDSPTDVEMEILSRAWSDSVSQKTLHSRIMSEESSRVPLDGVIESILNPALQQIRRPWLLTPLGEGPGAIAIDEQEGLCLSVYSDPLSFVLDPYQGALTGMYGAQLKSATFGKGAQVILNTDVCWMSATLMGGGARSSLILPERVMHPQRVLESSIHGVSEAADTAGVPCSAGSYIFDERFLCRPNMVCFSAARFPLQQDPRTGELGRVTAGSRLFVFGEKVGKDFVHGAVLNSIRWVENPPGETLLGASPEVHQRVLTLIRALSGISSGMEESGSRDLVQAYSCNGAGGVILALARLARSCGGARIDLSEVHTKYSGIKPWEVAVSETQPLIFAAVPMDQASLFRKQLEFYNLDYAECGEFNESGKIQIDYSGKTVGYLHLQLLFESAPVYEIQARGLSASDSSTQSVPLFVQDRSFEIEGPKVLVEVLGRLNVLSRESFIRQLNHEVQGASVIKPFHTMGVGTHQEFSGPNDGAVVLWKPGREIGIATGVGTNVRYGDWNLQRMAEASVDEAIRNLLCLGAEYGRPESVMAFAAQLSWPEIVRDPQRCAGLVKVAWGLRDVMEHLGVPLISLHSNFNLEYSGEYSGKPLEQAIPPCVSITAVGRLMDIRHSRSADFKSPGDILYLLGGSGNTLGLVGSELQAFLKSLPAKSRLPQPHWDNAQRIYSWLGGGSGKEQARLHSVHDVSEGGLLVSVVESLVARGFGAFLTVPQELEPWEFAFAEGFHSFVVSAAEGDAAILEAEWLKLSIPYRKIGGVMSQERLDVSFGQMSRTWSIPIRQLRAAWKVEGLLS